MFYGTAKNNCQSARSIDYSEAFRILNTTCVELAFLELLYRYEQGKNVLKLAYLQKLLSLVNAELGLLNLKIRSCIRQKSCL